MTSALHYIQTLSGDALRVWAALTLDASGARAALAERLGLSDSTLRRRLGELERAGVIAREGRRAIQILVPCALVIGEEPAPAPAPAPTPEVVPAPAVEARVERLEDAIAELRAEVSALRQPPAPAPPTSEPAPDTARPAVRQSTAIITSYRRLRGRGPSDFVEIYDLQQASKVPLEALCAWLLARCEEGRAQVTGTNMAVLPSERQAATVIWRGERCALVRLL